MPLKEYRGSDVLADGAVSNLMAESAALVDLQSAVGARACACRVPRDASVEVNAVSADVTVSETTGRQVLKIVSGNVQTQIEAADADITAVSGDVRMRSAGLATNVQVNSVSGDIGGCLDVAAERTSKYAPGQRLRVRRGEGQATLRLKSMSGDIDICDR